jgi:hypothetical protein
VWGRKPTVPCPRSTLATQCHRTLDFGGVNINRSQAGPDPARVVEGEQDPSLERMWIALMPGDYPARLFADTELYHLVGGIAWPGPHHRGYGNAKVDHNACCPGRHASRPTTSRRAGELGPAMRVRLTRSTRRGAG